MAVAGSNGAGKTSLLSAIAGVARKGQRIEGRAIFQGSDLQWGDVPGHIDAGIRLVPERDKVFSLLTVAEISRSACGGAIGRILRWRMPLLVSAPGRASQYARGQFVRRRTADVGDRHEPAGLAQSIAARRTNARVGGAGN
ncbi:MAG: ATP-binding cassette domain-containing protein [Bradyrhizobium sp.]